MATSESDMDEDVVDLQGIVEEHVEGHEVSSVSEYEDVAELGSGNRISSFANWPSSPQRVKMCRKCGYTFPTLNAATAHERVCDGRGPSRRSLRNWRTRSHIDDNPSDPAGKLRQHLIRTTHGHTQADGV